MQRNWWSRQLSAYAYDWELFVQITLASAIDRVLKQSLGNFGFSRHFLKSIFNLFPNRFFCIRLAMDREKDTNFSAPYRPLRHFFHFLVPSFLVFGPISRIQQSDSWNFDRPGFHRAHDFYFFPMYPNGCWVLLKNENFPKNKKKTQKSFSIPTEHETGNKNSFDVNLRVYTSIFTKFSNLPFEL